MEVVVPMKDFLYDTTASSYLSAPSSPLNYYPCHYGSAPTSPTRAAAIYAAASTVRFDWKDAPGTPKSHIDEDDDFEFEFSGQIEKGVLLTAADELFDQGKIRPLKPPPPPCLYSTPNPIMVSSPRSPKGPRLFSPHRRRNNNVVRNGNNNVDEFDPFVAAMERGRRGVPSPSSISSSSRSRKGSRSLSPMRGNGDHRSLPSFTASPNDDDPTSATATRSKKWRLRDFLLFRSASEGRATGITRKDPMRKFTIVPSSGDSSFRSTDSGSSHSGGSSMRHRRGKVSLHEKHYTSNRAAAEELKKKTALPFGRHGLFGCMAYNPAVQSIARGLQSNAAFNRRP